MPSNKLLRATLAASPLAFGISVGACAASGGASTVPAEHAVTLASISPSDQAAPSRSASAVAGIVAEDAGASASAADAPAGAAQAGASSADAARAAAVGFGTIGILDGDGGTPKPPWDHSDGGSAGMGGLGLSGIGESGGGRGEGISIGLGSTGESSRSPKVRLGAVTVNGRLPPEVVQRIVRQNLGRLRLCYLEGLKGSPKLAGQATAKFVIGKGGSVTSASSGDSDLPNKRVIACVVHSFTALTFPAPEGGTVTVSYPIRFSPPEEP